MERDRITERIYYFNIICGQLRSLERLRKIFTKTGSILSLYNFFASNIL
jgi:hypothetical protein